MDRTWTGMTTTPDMSKWDLLATATDAESRETLSLEECNEASEENLAAIQSALHTELLVVTSHARKLADSFWAMNHAMREENDPELQGYFGTRARLRDNTLSIDWYRNYFIRDKVTGKKRPISKHIAKGEGFRYSNRSFKGAKEWEQEVIAEVEDQYAVLRKRAHLLRTMRRAMSEYQALMKEESN